MKSKHIKLEFKRRLVRLRTCIDWALDCDNPYLVLPALYKVFSYLWSKIDAPSL